jgi:hypothetical protein
MRHWEFMSKMLRPTYVWRMASAKVPLGYRFGDGVPIPDEEATPYVRGARTSMTRAQRQIDDLVLERAATIADERRCAAVAEIDNPKGPLVQARCEFQRGHGKVGPGLDDSRLSHVTAKRDWDHGAPSAGTWWMDPVEQG